MKYRINEIFYSLQGEGFFTGTPAVFIRFAGCNLKCDFCDTRHETINFEFTLEELIGYLSQFKCKRVIFTGGEPTLQVDDDLIHALYANHYYMHIETNGTQIVSPKINWITVSPKLGAPWVQRFGHELKVVYVGQDLRRYFIDSAFPHFYLQPCSMKNIMEVVEICLNDPRWTLSLQTQKMLNIR